MRDCVRELCILSIFCGSVLSLCPEGGAKRIVQILSSVVLLAVILNSIKQMDLSVYALELAKYREQEKQMTASGEELRERMNRLVIEEECQAYVEQQAEALGIRIKEIHIMARWSTEGLWFPDRARIRVDKQEDADRLSRILVGELGIPAEKQEWLIDD